MLYLGGCDPLGVAIFKMAPEWRASRPDPRLDQSRCFIVSDPASSRTDALRPCKHLESGHTWAWSQVLFKVPLWPRVHLGLRLMWSLDLESTPMTF